LLVNQLPENPAVATQNRPFAYKSPDNATVAKSGIVADLAAVQDETLTPQGHVGFDPRPIVDYAIVTNNSASAYYNVASNLALSPQDR